MSSSKNHLRSFLIDQLESRRLFSFGILGTEAPDTFTINVESDNTIHLNFNGGIEIFDPPSDHFVFVSGFGGDDIIWVQNTGTLKFDLGGFAGNDTYRIGNGVLERDIKENVRVEEFPDQPGPPAHGGVDSIVIDDSISSGGTNYDVHSDSIRISSSPDLPVISWIKQPVDSVKIQGSRNADILFVENLPSNSIFDLGDGDDVVAIGAPAKMVRTDLPDNATIKPGDGINTLIIDDSSSSSPRNSIDIDDSGLLNSVDFRFFHKMEIRTHQLASGDAEPVRFRGHFCPASDVTIVGVSGPDLVQFGTFQNPIDTAELYVNNVTLKLKDGENKFEVDESDTAPGHAWKLIGDTLQAGIMNITNPLPIVGPNSTVDVTIKATPNADHFLVARAAPRWAVRLRVAAATMCSSRGRCSYPTARWTWTTPSSAS